MITSGLSRQFNRPGSMSSSQKYQRHIDGLRAVAVLSVIFYHFGQTTFSGGFVGVDVFFVISGYLITGLILNEIQQTGSFRFGRFYIRRMRRLFPAMAVTFLVTAVVAANLFSPEAFQAFGRSLAAAVFSVSNILFWTESGYFDADSHHKPLLKTWSLSVEEQFYLIWPALLWLFTRNRGQLARFCVLATAGLASFWLNHLWVTGQFDAQYASAIFYLTPFRIFELVIGAMALFIAPWLPGKRWLHELTMLLGLALIAFSVFTYTDGIVFPYLYALPPCIGALLVILSPGSRTIGQLLTNRLVVGIGLISYSMYLVHWPLLVLYQYYRFEPLTQAEYLALFAATVLLSIFMYFFVEKTFRKNAPSRHNPAPQKTFVLCSTSAMLCVALIGLYIHFSGGATWNNQHALSAELVAKGKQQRLDLIRTACNLARLDQPKYCKMDRPYQILVFGNSHEPDGLNAFASFYGQDPAVNLISFGTTNTCNMSLIDGVAVSSVTDRLCDQRVALLSQPEFVAQLDAVVYSANNPFAANKRVDWKILETMRNINKDLPIAVLGSFINITRDCSELYSRFGSFDACKDPRYLDFDPFHEKRSIRPEIDYLYIDKTQLLCSGPTVSSCVVTAASEPIFYDKHHLTLAYATMLGQRIAATYGRALYKAGFPPIPPD
jgi:peptidoglycan/LPS O-acetylase OafA/YrhL